MSARLTAVVVVLVIAGLALLRANTMSRETVAPDLDASLVVEFSVDAKRLPAHELPVVASAIFDACRLQAEAGVSQPLDQLSRNRFRAVLTPSPNATDRTQLAGCLSDLTFAHTYSGDVRMREVQSDQA